MTTPQNARWLEWCKRLQAIAQNGITFARDAYDLERYQDLRRIVAEMLAEGSGQDQTFILELLQNDTGYCTPEVDVRGVVFRDDKILLVRDAPTENGLCQEVGLMFAPRPQKMWSVKFTRSPAL